ncbi:MAG TPA: hemolysin family protein [Spirochaetota bacterium]|nr:hemolysin family protein [Spirochaetota bacterium]HNT11550.1 hemolysin family protein [Spirochaetota bacterium]
MFELTLIITLFTALSFLCSLLEAVILSVGRPYIQTLIDAKKKSGAILQRMKDDIDEPIAAILTLNTIAHTMGAAVSGAIAVEIFGSKWMGAFSAVLTVIILVLSEIIPKTIGARYWKRLSPVSAYLLRIMVTLLKPIIVPMNLLSRLIARGNHSDQVSKDEVFNFAKIGFRQGAIDSGEFVIIENVLKLKKVRVQDIMTPRTVVVSLDPDARVTHVADTASDLSFSRLPLYDSRSNTVHGVVLRRDIMNCLAEKKIKVSLRELSRKPEYVPGGMSVLALLSWFTKTGVHMGFVVNEHGDYIGVVTIEDAIESLLGVEIVDEFDPAVDMQAVARKKMRRNKRI